jgi:hypothetical protein
MSDIDRLRAQYSILEARRQALLENADYYKSQAEKARFLRDRPPDPTRAYEHQLRMDADARRLEQDSLRASRDAESTLVEQRGIERELIWRTRNRER